jgi:thiamine biosynthesis lipoprotein
VSQVIERVVDARFPAMGTQVHVRTVGGVETVAQQAQLRIAALEDRWSRFRRGSDVSELNRSSGRWVPVAWETVLLLERAVAAARATDGRFDPTVGGALVAHGYDRTFAAVPLHACQVEPSPVIDGSWPAIEVDAEAGAARLPEGTLFDPGGIGKGLAADLVAEELAPQVDGILVNVGGDVRISGTSDDPAGWVVSIEDPFDLDQELTRLAIPSGAVATSSKQARRWTTLAGPAHHIIDPSTGRPARGDVTAVTVVAAEAWWAEVQATSLFLQGADGLAAVDDSVEALLVLDDGTCVATPGVQAVLR